MNISDRYSEMNLIAHCALIVYSSTGHTLCTLNEIADNVILPGVPVDASKLAGLFKTIGRGEQPKDGTMVWQSENIIARGPNAVMWYVPPAMREIYFSCSNKQLMKCSGKKFPYPGMVFLARGNSLRAFAVKTRPNRKTKLYRAPFWNINGASGWVCMPYSSRRGKQEIIPEEFERIFFTSAFSHPGGNGPCCKTRFERLVPALIRSKTRKFPSGELIPAKITIQNLIEEKQKP